MQDRTILEHAGVVDAAHPVFSNPAMLTPLQLAFCAAYARSGKPTAAFREAAGSECRWSKRQQAERARKFLLLPKVQAHVAELRGDLDGAARIRAEIHAVIEAAKAARDAKRTGRRRKPIRRQVLAGLASVVSVVTDLEALAVVAFDERRPDTVRLIALRALTAGLAALGRDAAGVAAQPAVTVTLNVEVRPMHAS